MHVFIELGVKVGLRLVLVGLSWTTAWRHGVHPAEALTAVRTANLMSD